MSSAASTIVVRVVGDRGLVQNLENVPDEMAYGTAEEAARRLMTIDSDEFVCVISTRCIALSE